jgi:hypothetical protein
MSINGISVIGKTRETLEGKSYRPTGMPQHSISLLVNN